MNTHSVNPFHCAQQVDLLVQEINQRLDDRDSLTSDECYALFKALDQALKPIYQLQETAARCSHMFDRWLKECPTLFNKLVTRAMEHDVKEIGKEASKLKASLLSGNLEGLAQRVNGLRKQIAQLLYQNALPTQHLSNIRSINKFLDSIEKYLCCLEKAQGQPTLPKWEGMHEADPAMADLLMQIFEIAELIESGHSTGLKRKKELPAHIQTRADHWKMQLELMAGYASDKFMGPALIAAGFEESGHTDALGLLEEYYSLHLEPGSSGEELRSHG